MAYFKLQTGICGKYDRLDLRIYQRGAPVWLSQWSVWLRLKSWSHGLWVLALRRVPCWQLRAWSLLRILSLFLSFSLSFSLSKVNKIKKKYTSKTCELAHVFTYVSGNTAIGYCAHWSTLHIQWNGNSGKLQIWNLKFTEECKIFKNN